MTMPFDHTQPYREVRDQGTLLWIPHTALPCDVVTESGYTDLSQLRPSNGEPQPMDPVPVIDLSHEFDMAQLGAGEDVASVSDSTDDFTVVSSVFSAEESASSEDRIPDSPETAPAMLLERMRDFLE